MLHLHAALLLMLIFVRVHHTSNIRQIPFSDIQLQAMMIKKLDNTHYDHSSGTTCQLPSFHRILRISACFRTECEASNRQPTVSIS